MGMNIAPPAMSREEFEARKAGLNMRRKHENERRVERYMKHYKASLFCEGDVFVAFCVALLGLWGRGITVLCVVEGMFGLFLSTTPLCGLLVAKLFCVTIN